MPPTTVQPSTRLSRAQSHNNERLRQRIYLSVAIVFAVATSFDQVLVTAFSPNSVFNGAGGCHVRSSLTAGNFRPLLPFQRSKVVKMPTVSRLFMVTQRGQDQWETVLSALQLYKIAFGDLRVPIDFVVPSLEPWPEGAWGLKLGQIVLDIRHRLRFVNNNKDRHDQLDRLGFVWRLRSKRILDDDIPRVSMDVICDALKMYQAVIQPDAPFWVVPVSFVVPNSERWPEYLRQLPLGRILENITSEANLLRNPKVARRLRAFGLDIERMQSIPDLDTKFQAVYEALKRYKEIYGDLLVPQQFQIPTESDDWPKDTWGMHLGTRVNSLRAQGTFVKGNPERRKALDALGFEWDPFGRSKSFASLEDESTSSLYANEPDSNYDEEDDEVDPFFALFESDPIRGMTTAEDDDWGLGYGSEDGYEDEEEEDYDEFEERPATPPPKYVPPQTLAESLERAEELALRLGVLERDEDGRLRKGRRKQKSPWFNDDFGGKFVFGDVVEALTLYKKFHGNFSKLNNTQFVIPFRRDMISPFEDIDIDSMEARLELFGDEGFDDEDLEADVMAFDGVTTNPENGESTEPLPPRTSEVKWPMHLCGMHLGKIVARIRDGSLEVKHMKERREQLDAIGFDWGDPKRFIDVPFEKALSAMYIYFRIRGDTSVAYDFKMPDEVPWPQALAGYELGQAVKRIRELQYFLEAYHPEKVNLLRLFDFVWIPSLAQPLEPDQDDTTDEFLRLCALGHPDIAKMVEVPLELHQKLLADGPFFETDDPSLWWRKYHSWEHVAEYWYERGRRDNGFYLRKLGYLQMADEHEEKYGPGLFAQIDATMSRLDGDNEVSDPEERTELLERLTSFRSELEGCTDVTAEELDKMSQKVDTHMLYLLADDTTKSADEHLDSTMGVSEDELSD